MATSRKTPPKAGSKTPKAAPTTKATAAGPRRRAAARPAAAEAAAPAPSPVPAPASTVAPAPAESMAPAAVPAQPRADAAADARFRRSDLIEAVTERTAIKKSDAKVVIDLVLEELGRALDRSGELALPPLGKLSVKRRKPDPEGSDVLTLKLRRPGPAKGGESPLADPDEDG